MKIMTVNYMHVAFGNSINQKEKQSLRESFKWYKLCCNAFRL